MRSVCLFLLAVTLAGCGGDNPSSSRALNRLLFGTWIVPEPGMQFLSLGDRTHVVFNPDESFIAPTGIAAEIMRQYEGRYWQEGDFIGTRGVGERLDAGGGWQGGLVVKFAKVEVMDLDLQLTLTILEVKDPFIREGRNVDQLSGMTSSRIQATLKWLNKQNLSPDAFEGSRFYVKIEEIPN